MRDPFGRIVEPRAADEPFGHPEHLLQPAAEHGRHARGRVVHQPRAADLQHAQARQVGPALRLFVEPQQRERRHERGMRDAFLRDQREALFGLGPSGRDHAAAREQRTDRAGAAQREVVRHRQRGEVDGAGVESARDAARAHVVQVFAMAARNQLRRAGRAARQLEARDVVGACRAFAQRRRVVQRVEWCERVIVAVHHDVLERRAVGLQRGRERPAVELAESCRAQDTLARRRSGRTRRSRSAGGRATRAPAARRAGTARSRSR